MKIPYNTYYGLLKSIPKERKVFLRNTAHKNSPAVVLLQHSQGIIPQS